MLFASLEHIEVFLVIFSETSETGHEGFPENWVIWHRMTPVQTGALVVYFTSPGKGGQPEFFFCC